MFYFEQVFFFFLHINQQNKLEWFLLIICKEHTLPISTSLFKRNHLTLPNTEQLFYQTKKRSHRRCSKRRAVLKSFAILTWKHLCWSLFFNFIKTRLQHRYFTMAKLLKAPILKNICIRLLLNWLKKVIVWNFVSGQSLSKLSWLGNTAMISVAFKPEL